MLINGKRALAYTARVNNIQVIEGADNIELGHVGGWPIICKKGEFAEGDQCIYFEIDSLLPSSDKRFAFMEKKGYKVKSYKLNKFGVIGQGLAIPVVSFPELGTLEDGVDLTDKLGVKYYIQEDNKRKAPNSAWQSVCALHPNLMKKWGIKWLAKREWGRKVIIKLWGRGVKAKDFPTKFPFIRPTDQERCECIPWVLETDDLFIRTQKCDGSSGTYILERKGKRKYEFYVCSRNVRQLDEGQSCFYDENYYWKMAKKYDIEKVLKDLLAKHPEWDYICIQGEVCGPKIQSNPHGLSDYHLFVFHLINSESGKMNIIEAEQILVPYGLEMVPIDHTLVSVKMSMEDFKATAVYNYDPACCEGQTDRLAEGYVYYKMDDPSFHFKNVSREYLLKHN